MTIASEQDRQLIFGNFAAVGNAKPMGYLPLNTLENHLAMEISEVVTSLEKRGLKTKIFPAEECCINSGALYVYDPSALQSVLNAASDVLRRNGWPIVSELFVDQAAKCWIEDDPIYPVIQSAFGHSR